MNGVGVMGVAGSPPRAAAHDLEWVRDGAAWPLNEYSRFVTAGGVDWHVQVLGRGPVALLLHGTGASTHSYAPLARALADSMTLIIPDLPGHAFSRVDDRRTLSLAGMRDAVTALLGALDREPALVIGHSAGAAIALELVAARGPAAPPVVSLNGALLPFGGLPGRLFAPLARGLAGTALVPRMVARRARRAGVVERLAAGTGSQVPAESLACYRRLARSPAHVHAALAMMARWDLVPFAARLAQVRAPLALVVGTADRMVPPADAERVAARVANARIHRLERLGHLAHEEAPDAVAAICRATLEDHDDDS
ncbi:MAG: alpha/beta fold hydrolase, partial [Gammaproteobacteria bacterium]